ncbi:MAG: hypothetical protein M3Y04_02290 [Actinomycetota bacterium]|nr:hypothetical protein [Actinomycetota bacterium]
MNGPEPPGSEAPAIPAEGRGPAVAPEQAEPNVVITTVVGEGDAGDIIDWGDEAGIETAPPPPAPAPAKDQAVVGQRAAVEHPPAPLEGVAESVEALRQATRQEFERCAGVLFSHDRGLRELNDRLAAMTARVESVEAQAPAALAQVPPAPVPAPMELYEQALGQILEQVEGLDRRVQAVASDGVGARVAGLEERVASLDPLPAVVQALRVMVRADEEILAAEVAAREGAANGGGALGGALEVVAGRLAAVEGRVAPLEAVPDDVAALGRIVRRELDAVTTDVKAREQVLRRALQKEIERLHSASEDRKEAARETAQLLELVERRLRGTAQTHEDAVAVTTRRLEALESRLVSVDGLADDLDTLRAGVRRELERLRAVTQTQDQSIAETGKRFAALDGRLTRLDALPGEVQALRSAIRQEGERAVVALRSVEERTAELSEKAFRQLRQLADSVTQAHERTTAVTAELESTRAFMRSMEVALAETTERLDSLTAPAPPASAPNAPESHVPEPEGQVVEPGPEGAGPEGAAPPE